MIHFSGTVLIARRFYALNTKRTADVSETLPEAVMVRDEP